MEIIVLRNFNKNTLKGRTALITGAGGLLGPQHAIALTNAGAKVILVDINKKSLEKAKDKILKENIDAEMKLVELDITNLNDVYDYEKNYSKSNKYIDILLNNAAVNPKMLDNGKVSGRIEDYDMNDWNNEINVGLTGSFICSRVFGSKMAENSNGVIINISSDLAIRAPDQRVYSPTLSFNDIQSFKPMGYSVVKTALIGMTRYLAEYWGHKNVRVNALLPGGVYNNQSAQLVENVKNRTLLHRWANHDEYQDAIVFLASNSSAYMTGHSMIMDGGRSV